MTKIMAFMNVADLIGNVESRGFPQVYDALQYLACGGMRKVFNRGQSIPEGRPRTGKLNLRPDTISYRGCAGMLRAAEPALFPQKLRRPGQASSRGAIQRKRKVEMARMRRGYRNAGNGYGQYQNDGYDQPAVCRLGQTGQAAGGEKTNASPGSVTQANGTPQEKKACRREAWIIPVIPNMEAYKNQRAGTACRPIGRIPDGG